MKFLGLAISLLFTITSFSQEVELTVQTGHSAAINDAVFSPFDDFIATAGADNKIVIWDFESGKQFKVLLGHTETVNALCFHPDNEILMSCSDDSTVKFWDYQRGVQVDELQLSYAVPAAIFSSAGDRVYLGGEELSVLDYPAKTKKEISIKPKRRFTTLAVSDDDSKLLVGGEKEHIGYLFDLKDMVLLKKFTQPIIAGSFDEANNTVLFGTNNGLAISYNWVSGKKKSSSTDWMLTTVNDIVADSLFVYTADDYGVIRKLEKKKWFQQNTFRGKLSKIRALDISNDGKYLVSAGNNEAAIVWSLEEMRVVKVMKGMVNRINDIQFSQDGRKILVVYEDGSLRNTDLITNRTLVNRLSLNSDILSKIGGFSVVKITEFTEEYATVDALYKQSSLDMEGVYDVVDEYKVTWWFVDNILELEKKKNQDPRYKHYISQLKKGVYLDNAYFQDTMLRHDHSDTMGLSVLVRGEKLFVEDTKNQNFDVVTGHSDLVTSVEINETYDFIATASWDGMIRFWNRENHELLTVFGAFGDGQFVYINPKGYYFSSKNALEYIGFSMDNKMFSFEQFDLKYNRPDLVIKNLPYFDDYYEEAFEKAYHKRLDKLGILESEVGVSKNIPKIEITNDLSNSLMGNELTVSLKCKDKHHDLQKLHLFVNGVPEYGRNGKLVNGDVHNEELKITLNPGTNFIQCYVTNEKNASSLKNTVKVEAPKDNKKSDLYVLSIGVSAYDQKNYNLTYASKDARDIKDFLDESSRYDNIHSQLLLDAAASKENILSMRNHFANATENDVVVLFVAGHGVLDDNLDYFFAPHDMDFDAPASNGVPFEVFDEILDNTKSRKKIMFLDACHSGEIDKDEVVKNYVADQKEDGDLIFRRAGTTIKNIDKVNSFELSRALFADMRVNNGSTVISSSGGAEYAIEGEQWRNGVFTYCLLNGLKDKKADANKDRKISVSELQSYVQSEVHFLTKGKQTPTSRVENLNYDFVIN